MKNKHLMIILTVFHFLLGLLVYHIIDTMRWDAVGSANPDDFIRATFHWGFSMVTFFPFNALFSGLFLSALFSFPFGFNYFVLAILYLLNLLASFLTIYVYLGLRKTPFIFKLVNIFSIVILLLYAFLWFYDYFRFPYK